LIPKLAGRVTGVLLTPRGDRIITAAGSSARVWDAVSGEQIVGLLGHTNSVLSLALAPGGMRLVTGSRDMTARIWDLATGKTITTLRGHTGAVTSVAVSPNGRWIVTGSSDDTVRLWDASTGDAIAIIADYAVPVNSIAISPDGTRIASGWSDNSVRLSPLFFPTSQALIDRVKQTVPRCLTLAQLRQLHLLPLQPPRWCITGSGNEHEADSTKWRAKWPYQSEAWRNWLIASDNGRHLPMPEQ
jgi:WD40 repeat protein